ncbi:cyclin-T2 [Oncorhynchus mykiss]|nr:cyclin-T2 [Oncorhynchus mykiss]
MDSQTGDTSFQGTSSLDGITGVAGSNSFFSSSLSDSGEMASLDDMSIPFPPYQALSGDHAELLGLDQGLAFLPQAIPSKYPSGKHEHKTASAGKHPQALPNNPSPFTRPPQKLSLDKYREKQAADLQTMQNGVREEQSGVDMYQSPALPHHQSHKRRSQPGQGVPQHGDSRRDKASSKKTRGLPPQASAVENGVAASNEELKMRIKVSAERDQGGHVGVPQGKEKYKDHSGPSRHPKHGHSHPYSLSGNGRGAIDPALALRVLGGHGSDLGGSGSTSRKRANPDVSSHNNHHHSAKSSRSSKGAGGSSHYSSDGGGGPRTVERHHGGPEGSNGVLGSNGQHTDYKDTFDMLDSLLSAQGMNL